jgi:hypothetical protein
MNCYWVWVGIRPTVHRAVHHVVNTVGYRIGRRIMRPVIRHIVHHKIAHAAGLVVVCIGSTPFIVPRLFPPTTAQSPYYVPGVLPTGNEVLTKGPTQVPEPGALALLLPGVVGVALVRRARH